MLEARNWLASERLAAIGCRNFPQTLRDRCGQGDFILFIAVLVVGFRRFERLGLVVLATTRLLLPIATGDRPSDFDNSGR